MEMLSVPARLRAQTRCFEQALRMGNVGEASAIIERVAKDANNYWTHRLDVRHAGARHGGVHEFRVEGRLQHVTIIGEP
jgi:hypothetical protein